MIYESRFGKDYNMKSVTKDQDLWKYKDFEVYEVQELGLLCCCLHVWPG